MKYISIDIGTKKALMMKHLLDFSYFILASDKYLNIFLPRRTVDVGKKCCDVNNLMSFNCQVGGCGSALYRCKGYPS